MSKQYVRPYQRGAVTPVGWSVVCVPGMQVAEIVEPLASRLVTLVTQGRVMEAQTLLTWFGGKRQEVRDAEEDSEPLPI
jgi:hypothetical protein